MAGFFNADEVFEIAIDIEKNGEQFYAASAALASELKVKELFDFLVTQEQAHRILFEDMRNDLPAKLTLPAHFDPQGEAAMYLQALAGSHVFNDADAKKKAASGISDLNEALDFALTLEKDSVIFYQQMKEITISQTGRDPVESIIKEEKKHIIQLSDMKRSHVKGETK